MAGYHYINHTTLGSDTASVTFSAIPSFYDELRVLVSAKSTSTSGYTDGMWVRPNNNSSSVYTGIWFFYNGAGYNYDNGWNGDKGQFQYTVNSNSSSTSNYYGTHELFFQKYASANSPKNFASFGGTTSLGALGTGGFTALVDAQFASSSPISSLVLTGNPSSFKANTSIYLYGMKG